MIEDGATVAWCSLGYHHAHDCGPHAPDCDLRAVPPVCACGRCGGERLEGVVIGHGEVAILGDDPNVPTVVVEHGGPFPTPVREDAILPDADTGRAA